MYKYLLESLTGILEWNEIYLAESDLHSFVAGELMVNIGKDSYGVFSPLGSQFGRAKDKEEAFVKVVDYLIDLYVNQPFSSV